MIQDLLKTSVIRVHAIVTNNIMKTNKIKEINEEFNKVIDCINDLQLVKEVPHQVTDNNISFGVVGITDVEKFYG